MIRQCSSGVIKEIEQILVKGLETTKYYANQKADALLADKYLLEEQLSKLLYHEAFMKA